jgi:hypothetical protein
MDPSTQVERAMRNQIPLGDPLLVGRLVLSQPSPAVPPVAQIEAWRPYCRIAHVHAIPGPPFSPANAFRVRGRCLNLRWPRQHYWVAVDSLDGSSRLAAAAAARAFAAWETRQTEAVL